MIFHILQSSAQRYDRSLLQGNINKHVYVSQYIVRLLEIHKNLVRWTRDKRREQNLYNEDQRILGVKYEEKREQKHWREKNESQHVNKPNQWKVMAYVHSLCWNVPTNA